MTFVINLVKTMELHILRQLSAKKMVVGLVNNSLF